MIDLEVRTRSRSATIVVVDVDDVARTGYTQLLTSLPSVVRVEGLTHDQALARRAWDGVDVVLIDPVDPRRGLDQVPGAEVVERVRTSSAATAPRIVVVSSVQPDDMVRRRLAEAGADAYFHRSQVREAERLHRAVLTPEADDALPEPIDRDALHRLGITARTRVNRGVAAAIAECLVPEAGWVGPRGRDRFCRRARFNEQARLTPMGADGSAPDRVQEVPSLAQIQRFVVWATRVPGHG